MTRPLTALVVAALAMFGVQATPAGEEACFCYQDPEPEMILAGCQEIKGPNDAFPRISCRDFIGGGRRMTKAPTFDRADPGRDHDRRSIPTRSRTVR